MLRAIKKYKSVIKEKSMIKVLRHFKVDTVSKIDVNFLSSLDLCGVRV